MSSSSQRKDMCANALLAKGVNKTSIIAILCNAYTESAGTFDPKLTEYGRQAIFSDSYAFGCGIWQWSFPSNGNQEVYNYARSHSEADAIKMQCNKLVSEPGQWITAYLPSDLKMSFNDFLHNTKNKTWQELTFAWCYGWERPYDTTTSQQEGIRRRDNYNRIQPIHWSGSAPSGGNNTSKPSDNHGETQHKLKKLSGSECLSLLNKIKQSANKDDGQSNNNQKPPNTGHGGGGTGGSNGFDTKLTESEFNSHKSITKYSLSGLRSHIWTDWQYADCSSFVTRMVVDGWHLDQYRGQLYNTETMHAFLKNIGYHLVEAHESTSMQPSKPGDVFIMGLIGTSLGGNGHALISLDGSGMWECAYGVGFKYTSSIKAALDWDAYGGWCTMIYHYSKG